MYIVLDGHVELSINMLANHLPEHDIKELGKDVGIRDLGK